MTSDRSHAVWFDSNEPQGATLVERADLSDAVPLTTPAVITQFDATTLLPPGYRLSVVAAGSLLIEAIK